MHLKDHFLLMARYQAWAHRELLSAVDALPDPHYRRHAGLFYGSVHGTLNHLLVVERLWYARLAGEQAAVTALDEELYDRRGPLAAALLAQAAQWTELVRGFDDARLGAPLEYHSLSGEPNRLPHAAVIAHVFDHGTHHRGQITAALTAQRYPPPEIDLLYFAGADAGAAAQHPLPAIA